MTRIIAFVTLAAVLAGCTTTDPNRRISREPPCSIETIVMGVGC